jgi:hypothetical protein
MDEVKEACVDGAWIAGVVISNLNKFNNYKQNFINS